MYTYTRAHRPPWYTHAWTITPVLVVNCWKLLEEYKYTEPLLSPETEKLFRIEAGQFQEVHIMPLAKV